MFKPILFSALLLLLLSFVRAQQNPLTAGTWRGSYENAQGLIEPVVFVIQGQNIEVIDYSGTRTATTGSNANATTSSQMIALTFNNQTLNCLWRQESSQMNATSQTNTSSSQSNVVDLLCSPTLTQISDFSIFPASCADCLFYRLGLSNISGCTTNRLFVIQNHGHRYPLPIYRSILNGLQGQNAASEVINYGALLPLGISNLEHMGIFYSNLYGPQSASNISGISGTHLITQPLWNSREFSSSAFNATSDLQTGAAFSQGLYGLNQSMIIPVFGRTDSAFNPSMCSAYSNRTLNLQSVAQSNPEGVAVIQRLVQGLQWTNVENNPQLPSGSVPLSQVFTQFGIDPNTPEGQFILSEMFVESIGADLIQGRQPFALAA